MIREPSSCHKQSVKLLVIKSRDDVIAVEEYFVLNDRSASSTRFSSQEECGMGNLLYSAFNKKESESILASHKKCKESGQRYCILQNCTDLYSDSATSAADCRKSLETLRTNIEEWASPPESTELLEHIAKFKRKRDN